MDPWCYRCNRTFRTYHALSQHIRDSPRHYQCPECDFDGETWEELLEHCRDYNCRIVCEGCTDGRGGHWDLDDHAYREHLQDYHVCDTCDRHFDSENSLDQHNLTHRAAEIECLACYRNFRTYGGMIIHLESGACGSDIDYLDLNSTAAECYSWAQFIDADYRDDMLANCDLKHMYQGPIYPYKCPDCDTGFPKLSSLFQHVESSACDQMLNEGAIGRLRRFLSSRYG